MAAIYVCNAFSLSMLPPEMEATKIKVVRVQNPHHVLVDYKNYNLVSGVGHADTARLFSKLLRREIPANRINVVLSPPDVALVGQYRGPRLPEGATELPPGATIDWYLVSLES